jgi:hypothetical protein
MERGLKTNLAAIENESKKLIPPHTQGYSNGNTPVHCMSLLADLLSKTKSGSAPGTPEKPPHLDVPPTLSKARGIPAKVRTLKNRYVILSVICVAFIALGGFVAVKFGMLGSSATKKVPPPQIVQKPLQQPPVQRPVSTAKPPVATAVVAKITLGEPVAAEPHKKKAVPHKVKSPKCPPVAAIVPKAVAARPVKKVEPLPAHPGQKAAPRKIDTAARDSYLYAARSAEQTGDWKGALASYRKAQEIDPDDYKIMSNVAAALNNLGMFDDGAQEAERALGKKPDYVPALINAAIGYSSSGNAPKALRHFTFARALDPGNRSLVINLGILQERTGKLDDAQATYRQLASTGDPLALQGMGRVYERKGFKNEAARIYRQIMALPAASATLKKEAKGKLSRIEEQ